MAWGPLVLRCKRCGQPLTSSPTPIMHGAKRAELKCGCGFSQSRDLKWLKDHGLWPPLSFELPRACPKCGARRLRNIDVLTNGQLVYGCGGRPEEGVECDAKFHYNPETGQLECINP